MRSIFVFFFSFLFFFFFSIVMSILVCVLYKYMMNNALKLKLQSFLLNSVPGAPNINACQANTMNNIPPTAATNL